MANIKFTQLPVGADLIGSEIFAMVQGGVSVSTTADDIANFVADIGVNYGDGIAYDSITNTASADINTTNLQFTATQINTIQDIDITASPTFETMTLTSTTAGFLMPRMTTVEFDTIPTPDNGLIAWSTSSNRFRVNKGSPGSPDYDQLAYFNDIPQDTTAFGEVFFQGNAVETVISAIGIPAKVDAVYNAGDLLSFTNGSGLLTYTGLETKEFAINLSMTTTLNLSTADISVVVFINGSPLAKTEQGTFTGSTTPGFQSTSVNALVELSTNDIIEVYIKNNTSTDNITVQDLNLNVSTVGGAIGNLADQVVVAWDSSTSPVSVLAGTDIDITNGVISYTGGSPVTGPNGNFQLWEMTSPTLPAEYTLGQYLSITNTSQGDKFELVPVNISTVTQISGNFRWTFGPYVYELAEMIIGNPITTRSGTLKYTVTRINQNEISIDVNGYFVNSAGDFVPLLGNPGLVPNTFSYNANNTYLMEVEYRPIQGTGTGTAQQYLGLEAINNTVEQHTSRQGISGGGIVTRWDGSTQDVEVTGGNLMTITNGSISTSAEQNVVTRWDGSTQDVEVTGGNLITITNGSISTSAEQNVVTSVQGSTATVDLSSGTGIAISPTGVISATGVVASTVNNSFFTTLLPRDNYVSGLYSPVWFTSTGNNLIDANSWLIGDTFEVEIVGEFVTRGSVADTTTGSFFRLTVGSNQILTNDLDVPLIIDGQVRVKPFNFKIMFTRIQDIGQPTWSISGNGFFLDLSDNFKAITLQTNTLYNIDTTINNFINLEFQQNHTVNNTYDFQCVQLNMRKYTL
jgi:hypothetical protein